MTAAGTGRAQGRAPRTAPPPARRVGGRGALCSAEGGASAGGRGVPVRGGGRHLVRSRGACGETAAPRPGARRPFVQKSALGSVGCTRRSRFRGEPASAPPASLVGGLRGAPRLAGAHPSGAPRAPGRRPRGARPGRRPDPPSEVRRADAGVPRRPASEAGVSPRGAGARGADVAPRSCWGPAGWTPPGPVLCSVDVSQSECRGFGDS